MKMKLIIFGLAFVAFAAGEQYLPPNQEVVETQYLPPAEAAVVQPENQYLAPVEEVVQEQPQTLNEYLPPIEAVEPIEQIAEDGYRYKTVKRIRYRTRRDVSELTSGQYIPPGVEDSYGPPPSGPVEIVAPVQQESAILADDGYRYKTVKRVRHRHRRDVSELPAADYLPPVQQDDSYSYPAPAPVEEAIPVDIPAPVEVSAPVQESAVLADDGYRYKTVRRIRYRHRRDVNELPAADYLPPVQQDDRYSYPAPAPVEEAIPVDIPAPVEVSAPVQESAVLADDGYRYKTIRRIRYRHRRDVNELPTAEYLPPVQQDDSYSYPAPAPVEEAIPVDIPAPVEVSAPVQESAVLADDGYRYKTIRRIRYRHRRDVNELPTAEYLPPVQQDDSYSYPAPAPVEEAIPVDIPAPVEVSAPVQESAVLADDGYRYKTIRRIRYRHRRDVNELPTAEYLPPVQQDDSYSYPAPAPVEEAIPVDIPAPVEVSAPVQESAVLADDGYRYKTIRRIRYRHRRDVNELPTAEYLPPVQQDDSYSYPAPAPVEEAIPVDIPAPVEVSAPVQESAVLADDGYRYKTIRRIRYRHRRDVSELPTAEYLPPVQQDDSYSYPAPVEIAAPAPIEISAPIPIQQTAELAQDGYRYKTVKKYKIKRH